MAELLVAFIVIPFDRGILDGAVHPLNLAIGPWMVGLGQATFDPIRFTNQVVAHLAERHAVPVPRLLCKLDAIVCKIGVELVGHDFEQMFQELPRCLAVGLLNKLRDRELAGSINGNKEIELAFLGPNFSDIDMEIANRTPLELLPLGFVAFHVW